MSTSRDRSRIGKYDSHIVSIRERIEDSVNRTRAKAEEARTAALQKRDEFYVLTRQRLLDITESIRAKQELIKDSINQESIHRETRIRVNRGLQSLEGLVRLLREAEAGEEILRAAIRDPIVSSSIREEARKVLASDLVKSIQQQLIMQTEFINIAAHELRTPIMPILTSVELMKSNSNPEVEEVEIIERNALRLKRLAENILDLTRIESKTLKLDVELFNIDSLVSEVVRDSAREAREKGIEIEHPMLMDPAYVTADRARIAQVLYNLVNNSLKFVESGKIVVATTKSGTNVQVSVSDTGPGIDPRLLSLLFAKFVGGSYTGTGMGLGLFICKGIVEAHGGIMTARNNPGGNGATVMFTLPTVESRA